MPSFAHTVRRCHPAAGLPVQVHGTDADPIFVARATSTPLASSPGKPAMRNCSSTPATSTISPTARCRPTTRTLGEAGVDQRTADVGDVQHADQAGVGGDWQVAEMAAAHEHGYPKNRQSLLGGTSAQLTGERGCGHSQPAAVVPRNSARPGVGSRRPNGLAAPGGDGAGPRCSRSRLRFVMSRPPMSVGTDSGFPPGR